MIVFGLTGSIGMGKTTTARMFARHGVPVYDADRAVHDLYAGPAVDSIAAEFPGTVVDGVVDRKLLAARVVGQKDRMQRLEAIVHPLVRKAEQDFRAAAFRSGHRAVILDIPLLFETDGHQRVNACILATALPHVQRERVLARPGMTEETFSAILAKQMPDEEKRRRAHFMIDTGYGMVSAERQVVACLRAFSAMT